MADDVADDVYIAGVGSRLPGTVSLEDAERAGECDPTLLRSAGVRSACVGSESPPDMAVRAARRAIDQAGTAADGVALTLHASTYYQGHDMWSPASYVHRFAVGNACPAMEVRQMSNGGMAAVELAAAYLRADPSRTSALVTTADRFCLPGFDRWRSDPGTVCGDGATAAVLARHAGFARIRSLVSVSDAELEQGGRGTADFADAPRATRPLAIGANAECLVREFGLEALVRRIQAGQRTAFDRACDAAGVRLADVDRFALPTLGWTRLKAQYLDPFGIDAGRTTWEWGRRVGHLGAGDQIGGLAHLVETGGVGPGDLCVLAGVGAGFTWTVAVLDVLEVPAREPAPLTPR